LRVNRQAERAHMESEEVAAVNVLKTGVSDIKARNISMEDFSVFTPE
jgi:hypothetical protein